MEIWKIVIPRFVDFIWINRLSVAILVIAIMAGTTIRDRRRYIKVNRRFLGY